MPTTADLQAVLDKINEGINWIIRKINAIPGIVNDTVDHWYVPGFLADAVIWCARKVIELGQTVLAKIAEVMKGVAAPFIFIGHLVDWSDISGNAATVQGTLNAQTVETKMYWQGIAADAYGGTAVLQTDAAARVKKAADDAHAALVVVIAAGIAFYVALAVIIAQFMIGFAAACVALGSLVLSWAGVLAALGEAAVTPAAIIAAVVALGAVVAAQSNAFTTINAAAGDRTGWPLAVTANFRDGSVLDGDNDWSVRDR